MVMGGDMEIPMPSTIITMATIIKLSSATIIITTTIIIIIKLSSAIITTITAITTITTTTTTIIMMLVGRRMLFQEEAQEDGPHASIAQGMDELVAVHGGTHGSRLGDMGRRMWAIHLAP
jgi:ABC-type siderophore export system fused ATPase/permease subunit